MSCARGCCESPAEHYRSISFSADAMPTRRRSVALLNADDRRMGADHAAYRRLRAEGLQPPSTVGAAALEARAEVPFEVTTGRMLPKVKGKERRVKAASELVAA